MNFVAKYVLGLCGVVALHSSVQACTDANVFARCGSTVGCTVPQQPNSLSQTYANSLITENNLCPGGMITLQGTIHNPGGYTLIDSYWTVDATQHAVFESRDISDEQSPVPPPLPAICNVPRDDGLICY